MTGFFLNPAPYACLLSLLTVPFLYFLLAQGYSKSKKSEIGRSRYGKNFLRVVVILAILVIAFTENRVAIISLVITVFSILVITEKSSKLRLRRVVVFIPLFLIFVVGFSFFFKKESSEGRLFIWKIAINYNNKNLETIIRGNGYDFFERKYNLIQMDYFKAHPDVNSKEALLAGNGGIAYNELVDGYINYGLIGVLFYIGVVVWVYYSYYRNYERGDFRFHITFLLLQCFFVHSLISYPLNSLMVTNKLILFYSIVYFSFLNIEIEKRKMSYVIKQSFVLRLLIIILICFTLFKINNIYSRYKEWGEADFLYRQDDLQSTATLLRNVYPDMKYSGKFLAYYGRLLYLKKENQKAIVVLNESKSYSADPIVYYTLGQCYFAIGQHAMAESYLTDSKFISPNRLFPKYLLFKFYIGINNRKKAKELAKEIIETKEKIISPAMIEMKKNAEKVLQNQNF